MDATPFGHYQLQQLIGRGGMGEVYRAYDTRTDRIVALKVLPPSMAADETFQQRFRTIALMWGVEKGLISAADQRRDPLSIDVGTAGCNLGADLLRLAAHRKIFSKADEPAI
ncbi:hypothetical protein [Mycolicibacterium celeriflavum]|uniref:hypothetical protein n=1 Tax=Mycolicibacterium celeriflavum TaxID=1249101 RepID=UPI0009F621EA|nr:hypothetical protein [Mycolicibacterium celeriflavum]MCV7239911.1 hypothetical protein [Mycolicibacterium celeriflavum]ORA47239.1 hypothetical protein BST21_13395 [Mycolicibacterium celeriflavum]